MSDSANIVFRNTRCVASMFKIKMRNKSYGTSLSWHCPKILNSFDIYFLNPKIIGNLFVFWGILILFLVYYVSFLQAFLYLQCLSFLFSFRMIWDKFNLQPPFSTSNKCGKLGFDLISLLISVYSIFLSIEIWNLTTFCWTVVVMWN